MRHPSDTGKILFVSALFMVVVGVLVPVDMLADRDEGAPWSHIVIEGVTALVAWLGALGLGREWRAQRQRDQDELGRLRTENAEIQARSQALRRDSEQWKREAQQAIAGLSAAIDVQLERWALTTAEKEVALLLLKGLSTKEVADIRITSERTARQQAQAVYRKAHLAGRAELAAFFLEDLLQPRSSGGPPQRDSATR